jgi:hypothetical protein
MVPDALYLHPYHNGSGPGASEDVNWSPSGKCGRQEKLIAHHVQSRFAPEGAELTMQHYAPPQREIDATVFTQAGWMRGHFVVPNTRRFVEFTNHPDDFFKLRDVQLPSVAGRAQFFALQRDSVVFIVPHDRSERGLMGTLSGDRVERDVSCAFESGLVSGTLYVPAGLRVSDYLIQRRRFFELFDCEYIVRGGEHFQRSQNVPIVLVNANRIIGVSEPRVE